MKHPVCLALLFASVGALGFSQPALLTEQVFPELKPILATALQQSPRMLERNLDLDGAEGDRIQARAGLYPSASANFQDTKTKDRREDIPGTLKTDRLYYSFSVSQPLFHWGDIRNRAKIGDIRRNIALKQYTQAYAALAQEIRGAYLGLVLQKSQLRATKFSQEQAEQALKLAEDRLRNRVISDAEIFHPRIAVQQAVLNTERMQSVFEQTKRTFRRLTGSPISDDSIPTVISRFDVRPGEPQRLLSEFLNQGEPKTVATEVLKAQVEIERLNYSIARHGLYPRFNLIAGISQDEQSYSTNIAAKYGVQSVYVGVSGNWTIFDGFATRGAKRSSLSRLRRLEASYKQATQELILDAQLAATQLSFVERQMLIQEQLMDSTTNFLQYRKDEFSRGTVSETDVATVQAVYNRELITTLQLRSEYLLKYSDFIALISEDPALTNLPARFRTSAHVTR